MARRIRRPRPPGPRAQAILRAVIEEYVTTATPGRQPGAGRAVQPRRVERDRPQHPRGARARGPARPIRTPRPGASRPTRLPLLRRVDRRRRRRCPPVEQLMIRHQFGQVEFASEHWFRLAATTLAALTRAAGLATPAKPAAARLRRVDLVAIHDRLASLILVLREGVGQAGLVTLDEPRDQATLDRRRRPPQPAAGRRPDRRPDRRDASPGSTRTSRRRRARRAGSASGSLRTMREFDADGDRGGLQRRPAQRHGARRSSPRARSSGGSSSALENRAYLGELVGQRRRAAGRVQSSSARRTAARHARGLPRPGAVRPARPRRRRRRRARADADGLSATRSAR